MLRRREAAPYALLEPDRALVVEDEQGIAGFAIGTADTERWHETLEVEWWPALRGKYSDPSDRPAAEWSADERRAFAIHHPRRPPRQVSARYPAHLHLNLLERIQGRGVGARLFSEWTTRASRDGVGATHVGVNNANVRAVHFWSSQGFARVRLADGGAEKTIWMGRA